MASPTFTVYLCSAVALVFYFASLVTCFMLFPMPNAFFLSFCFVASFVHIAVAMVCLREILATRGNWQAYDCFTATFRYVGESIGFGGSRSMKRDANCIEMRSTFEGLALIEFCVGTTTSRNIFDQQSLSVSRICLVNLPVVLYAEREANWRGSDGSSVDGETQCEEFHSEGERFEADSKRRLDS